ncbi:holo-ACP synthase [Planctomycetota bacterium]
MKTIIAHGIDLVDCHRIELLLERHGEHFTKRVYTEAELAQAPQGKRRSERLSGRFAAKEAIMKLIGTGWRDGVAWTDMEVVNDTQGCPQVNLYGKVKEIVIAQGIGQLSISITHTANLAIASVVALVDHEDTIL